MLDGGPGNNTLNGGSGVDLATFAGSPVAVVVDLSGTTDTAKRGGETDTLIGIEGAIGSAKADTFKGDVGNNEFQGGLGKDTATGGGGRDLYDFNAVADSPAGASRDVVTDFVPGQDVIDLAGIDADTHHPRRPVLPLGRQGDADRRGAARLLCRRRQHDRARQHRCRCRGRAGDPAHRQEDADRGRLSAIAGGLRALVGSICLEFDPA